MSKPVPPAIAAAFGLELDQARVEYLGGAGGFSGARLWRVTPDSWGRLSSLPGRQIYLPHVLCLRRWPPQHPDEARLQLIHNVLKHAVQNGIDYVPAPLLTSSGQSYLRHDGHLWELSPWMPGKADPFARQYPLKLQAAMGALALFHQALADFPSAGRSPNQQPSPGIAARLQLLREWSPGKCAGVLQRVGENQNWPQVKPLAVKLLKQFEKMAPRVEHTLMAATALATRLQPAIRDIWSDHVLFTGQAVTGIVDFGGLNIESPAADVARLLGSLAQDDAQSWRAGLHAYEEVRSLSETEHHLIRAFDESTVVLSGLNWLQWIYLDGRQFENPDRVVDRLNATLIQMRHRTGTGALRPPY
jgi:homoserine kinase type II